MNTYPSRCEIVLACHTPATTTVEVATLGALAACQHCATTYNH